MRHLIIEGHNSYDLTLQMPQSGAIFRWVYAGIRFGKDISCCIIRQQPFLYTPHLSVVHITSLVYFNEKIHMNLIEDPIPKLIKDIAVPASVGFFFNTMYNVVDIYYVGMLSTEMVAALSLTFPMFFIILAFGIGIGQGATALIANAMGENNQNRVMILAIQSFSFTILMALIISIIGIMLAPTLLGILGATDTYLDYALSYINIVYLGSVFLLVQFTINASLNAKGDTKTFRNVLIVSFVLNLGLDPWLMFGGLGIPAMGIKGVAVATVIIQALGSVYLYRSFKKASICQSIFCRHLIPDFRIFKEIFAQAFPASVNTMTVAAGVFIITFFISKFGQAGVAAFGIATRIEQMVLIPTIGLNIAVLTLTGQNNGAGKLDRVRAAWKKSLWYGFLMMLIGTILVLVFSRQLIVLFTADDMVIGPAIQYLRISALIFFAYVILFTTVALLQGLKKPMYAIWVGVFRQIAAPIPVFWLLSVLLQWELLGIWWGIFFIAWSSALFTLWYGKRILDQVSRDPAHR
jgi:putative MATE family efflux protein